MATAAYSLTTACLRTKAGYFALRNAILRGELKGWKDADGRWQVDADDLDRFVAAREQADAGPKAAA